MMDGGFGFPEKSVCPRSVLNTPSSFAARVKDNVAHSFSKHDALSIHSDQKLRHGAHSISMV